MQAWRSIALAVLLAGAGVTAEIAADYTSLWDAFDKLGLPLYSLAVSLAGLKPMYQDPNMNGIVFAASTSDMNQAIMDFQASQSVQDKTSAMASALFLVIPQPDTVSQATLSLHDGLTLATQLTRDGDPSIINTTITNITFRDLGNNRWYMGGSPPGAILDLNERSFTAGRARLYITEGYPVPPSKLVTTPGSPASVLSLLEAMQLQEDLSMLLQLFTADRELLRLITDPDKAITLFAPDNQAIIKFLSDNQTTLDQLQGSLAARDLLLGHVIASRPYMIRQFPTSGLLPMLDPLGRQLTVAVGTLNDDNANVSVVGVRNLDPLPVMQAPLRDLHGGKSVMHVITGGLILPGVGNSVAVIITSPPSTSHPSGAAPGAGNGTATSSPPAHSGSSKSGATAAIIASVVGSVVLLSGLGIALLIVRRMRHRPAMNRAAIMRAAIAQENEKYDVYSRTDTEFNGSENFGTGTGTGQRHSSNTNTSVYAGLPAMVIPGVPRGLFTRTTAMEYAWTTYVPQPGVSVAVEAGVNDMLLDKMVGGKDAPQAAGTQPPAPSTPSASQCPVVRLSKEQLVKEIKLLRTGLLGKGATALVFQCLWPSRFGTDSLLAAKVLRDGNEADPHHRESFVYEASVLASVQHPNIVRLYGYCLEGPTICLIMELLPTSLRNLLYSAAPLMTAIPTRSSAATLSQGGLHLHASAHTTPTPPTHPYTRNTTSSSAQLASATNAARVLSSSSMQLASVHHGGGHSSGHHLLHTASTGMTLPGNTQQQQNLTNSSGVTLPAHSQLLHHLHHTSNSVAPQTPHASNDAHRLGSQSFDLPARMQPGGVGGESFSLHTNAHGASFTAQPATPSGSLPEEGLLLHQGHAHDGPKDTPKEATKAHPLAGDQEDSPDVHPSTHSAPQAPPAGQPSNQNTEHSHKSSHSVTARATSEILGTDAASQQLLPAKKLSVLQVLNISTDIAAGLAYLHDRPLQGHGGGRGKKVVHRDLKPANILINSQGRAKISDFGLARQHHQTTIATRHMGAGTLPYMAPELLLSAAALPGQLVTATNRVDIYSLAMIMWEMLAGHMPWQGSADAALLTAVTQGRRPLLPEPPAGQRPPLPDVSVLQQPASLEAVPQFNNIIRACWRQREHRRPNANLVYAELVWLLNAMGQPTGVAQKERKAQATSTEAASALPNVPVAPGSVVIELPPTHARAVPEGLPDVVPEAVPEGVPEAVPETAAETTVEGTQPAAMQARDVSSLPV